jgi:hypothetical protein
MTIRTRAQARAEKERQEDDAQGGAPIPAPTVAVEGGRRRPLKWRVHVKLLAEILLVTLVLALLGFLSGVEFKTAAHHGAVLFLLWMISAWWHARGEEEEKQEEQQEKREGSRLYVECTLFGLEQVLYAFYYIYRIIMTIFETLELIFLWIFAFVNFFVENVFG